MGRTPKTSVTFTLANADEPGWATEERRWIPAERAEEGGRLDRYRSRLDDLGFLEGARGGVQIWKSEVRFPPFPFFFLFFVSKDGLMRMYLW